MESRLNRTNFLHTVLAVLLISLPPALSDSCTTLVNTARVASGLGTSFTTPSTMRKCLASFPFDADQHLPVLDTVINGLDTFYVYKQLAKASPSPRLLSHVDVVSQLRYLRQFAVAGRIKTLFSFFEKIRSVVQSLNDGHTAFVDNCMSAVSYLGLPVVGVVEGGKHKVRVMPLKDSSTLLLPYAMKEIHGIDISQYAGKQVQSIDGLDAFQYVLGYARKYTGVSRDLGTRLNIAFGRPSGNKMIEFGQFALRSRLPPKDSLTYRIWMSPTQLVTVKVPYMTVFNATFSDQQSYWRANCRLKPSGGSQAQRAEGGVSGDELMQAAAEEVTYAGWGEVVQGKVHEAGATGSADTTAVDEAAAGVSDPSVADSSTAREVAGVAAGAAATAATTGGGAAATKAQTVHAAADAMAKTSAAPETTAKSSATAGSGEPAIRPATLNAQAYPVEAARRAEAKVEAEMKPIPRATVMAEAAAAAKAEAAAKAAAAAAAAATAAASAAAAVAATSEQGGMQGGNELNAATAMRQPFSHPLQVPMVVDSSILKAIKKPHIAARPPPLIVRQFPHMMQQKKSAATSTMTNINRGGYFPVYLLSDGTAVIVYNTFAGYPQHLGVTEILNETVTALTAASMKGQRILFDMSSNGGGYTLLAWFLMRVLVGSHAMPLSSHSPMQFLVPNPAAKQFYNHHQAASRNTGEYLTPNATAPAVLTPYHFRAFGGPGGYYTKSFVTGDDIKGMELLGEKYPPGFSGRPIMTLTDGNCFSACAIFTHVMKKRFGMKVVTVGGLTSQPMSISSSCLGFVEGSLQDVISPLQGKIDGLPAPFEMNVDLAYAAAAMYVGSEVPCEYEFLAGDARVYYDLPSMEDVGLLWQRAATHF